MKISDSKLFSRPGSMERLIWPSREEIDYLKSLLKNILKSKIFWVGIGVFLLYLISDISVKVFIPKEMVYLFLPKVCFANFYHSSHPIISFIALLIIIRVLLFLRFKTWWRTNKFLDTGFAFF